MNLHLRFSALRLLGYFVCALFTIGGGAAQAQTAPVKNVVIKWPASESTDVTKYDIHYGTEAGFTLTAATLKKTFGVTVPPTTTYSYEHPATLPGEKHYYKVRIFDSKENRFTVTKEVAILKSGIDTYVFKLSYQAGWRSRAVAGGTEDNAKWDDPWHQSRLLLNITVSKNGTELPKEQPFDFSFEGNLGDDTTAPKRASLIDVDTKPDTPAQWLTNTLPSATSNTDLKQQLTRTADINGDIVARVISGQKILQPQLAIQWKDETGKVYDVTKIPLNLVASQSFRRFGVPLFGEFSADSDNGWQVTPDVVNTSGEIATMTLHLKFHSVEGDGDTTYPTELNAQGKPQPSTDAANWKPVNGHNLQISIAEVARKTVKIEQVQDGGKTKTVKTYYNALLENPSEAWKYVFFVNADGFLIDKDRNPLQYQGHPVSDAAAFPNYATVAPKFINVPTEDGTATVYLKTGRLIDKCAYFGLAAKDTTQTK